MHLRQIHISHAIFWPNLANRCYDTRVPILALNEFLNILVWDLAVSYYVYLLLHKVSFVWVVDSTWTLLYIHRLFKFAHSSSLSLTKIKPLGCHLRSTVSLLWVSCVAGSRIIPMSCDKISAFNYSAPIWGFSACHWREAATCCLLPSASRGALVCTNCLSSASQNQLERSDTHGWEGGFWRGWTFYGWREGVSIWYLVMVDIYGKSYWRVGPPYYIDHRPSLVSWTSPDVHGGICNFDFGFLQMWK